MSECNSIETTDIYSNLSNQKKIILNKINKFKDFLNSEIQEKKIMSKKLSKYISAFDYFDKTLIPLSATSKGVSIISFVSFTGAHVGIASASFSLAFHLPTGIIKKLLSITRNKKKKHNKSFMLTKSKLNSIKTLISQALIDLEICHEEIQTTVNEKKVGKNEIK